MLISKLANDETAQGFPFIRTLMQVPTDSEIYRSELGDFWFDDDGILCCNATPATRTIENLTETFEMVGRITGGKRACLLSDITNTGAQTKKERDFAMTMLPRHYKAMAVISHSDFGRTIANIFLTVYNLSIPMKLFPNEAEGKEWLKKFL